MRISQIEIGNFRSIHRQRFKADNVNILLGENDVGKSNVLHALNLFFQPTKRANFSDVHSDIESRLLSIKVTFEITDKNIIPNDIHSHIYDNYLVIHRKHPIHKNPKYYDKKGKQIDLTRLRRFFRDRFIYIPTIRDAAQHEKIVTLIHELIENPSEYLGKTVSEEAEKATRRLDKYMAKHLKDFTTLLCKNLNTEDVKITFAPDVDEILSLAKIRIGRKEFVGRLQSRGQGIQSLTLINLYRAMAKKASGFKVLALEEPEAHLHPNLLRSFAQDIFSNTEDMQIFLTTHSPFIVDQAKLSNIVRIVARDSKTIFIKPKKISGVEPNFYKYVHAKQSDIFFAKHVLLVEGPSDKLFLTTISSKISYSRYQQKQQCDFELHGVVALENEGKGFKNTIPILELFEIPWSILCDKDAWEKGPLISLIEKTGLKLKKPKIFRKLKEHHDAGHDLDLKIISLLGKFNIFCINGKLEDFIITEKSKPKVYNVLKNLFPKRFEEAKSQQKDTNEDAFLKKILVDEKRIWPKPLAIELASEDIHEEIVKNIQQIVGELN